MLLIIFKTKYFTTERRDVHFASHNSKLHHWVWAYSVNMSLVAIFPSPAIYREHNESVNKDNLLQISQYCRGLKHRPCLHTNGLTDWMLLSRSTSERPRLVCVTQATLWQRKKIIPIICVYNLRSVFNDKIYSTVAVCYSCQISALQI